MIATSAEATAVLDLIGRLEHGVSLHERDCCISAG
ncbi:MAG: hypothetical protein K7J15_05665 [Candidatus Regiella insecticola]|nr:hypothetical protein [Candidatus Regiella insecticola]